MDNKILVKANHITKTFHKKLMEQGLQIPSITLTEDMTEDEKEMAFMEMFMRHGYTIEEASSLASEEYRQYKKFWS